MSAPASPRAARPPAALAALLAGLFLAGAFAGYVYKYAPQPDLVSVRVERRAETADPRVIGGTVSAIEGGRITLATPVGPVTILLSPGLTPDELRRAPGGLPAGARVNVGVESTQYGLVLTGIVAVEGPR